MRGWRSHSSELITPSSTLSDPGRGEERAPGRALATGKRSLKIRLQLRDTDEFSHCLCECLFVGAAMIHAQVHVCLCQCVASTHSSGVTIPPLKMLHAQKGEQSSYLRFWSEEHGAGSFHVAHILAFSAFLHSACPSRLSAPRAT